jgi:glyoxylase-like metal-dependent hydrolase (beta-lactamase superfamily II)
VPDDPYAPLAAHGIHRVSIPTPFAVGRVNLYLIEDDPLTLVDAGPNSGTSLDELERQLEVLGRSIADLERVVITHQHIDHIGLVRIVAERSGAEVVALDRLVPFVEAYSTEAAAEDAYATEVMLRHGIPEDVAQALASVSLAFRAWGSRADVSRVVRDGEQLEFAGRSLDVHFRPGHSPTDTIFLDAERGVLIGGDHLIAHISSNPLIQRPLGGRSGEPGDGRPRALLTYLESLRDTRAMPVETVLAGHGEPVRDHAALIDERFAMHERRAERILGLVGDEPRSAHAIALELWGNVAVTQAYLTLCEVLGHVDLLLERGAVREHEVGGVVRFEAV